MNPDLRLTWTDGVRIMGGGVWRLFMPKLREIPSGAVVEARLAEAEADVAAGRVHVADAAFYEELRTQV